MSWLKQALSPNLLVEKNIKRYHLLSKQLMRLKDLFFATQSGSYLLLKNMMDHRLIRSNKEIKIILESILQGENNQKVMIDSPHKAAQMVDQVLLLINGLIEKEKRKAKFE